MSKPKKTTKRKRSGFGATCAIAVEQGKTRKVVADMAAARTLARKLAERHPRRQVKITKACSTGRGGRGETVGACTGSKCWGNLAGAKSRKRGVGMFDQVAATLEPGDERDYTVTIERGYRGHDMRGVRGLRGTKAKRGVRGTREEHRAQADFLIGEAEWNLDEATKAKGAKRRALALRAFSRISELNAVCGWAGGTCNESMVALREEVMPLVATAAERKVYSGLGATKLKRRKR